MKLYEIITEAQGGQAIDNLARAANVEPEQMDDVFRTVLPAFSNAIERNTLSRGGLADLVKALGDGHHEVILDNPQTMADPRVVQDGNEILGYILGSKDKSRGVAMQAAQASGLSEGLVKMLLPFIAQMVMGAIAKWAKGGLGDVIGKLPGGGGQGGGLPFPMPQGSPRGGGEYEVPRGGSGRGGFELPQQGELPQGGYPMPPIPGGSSSGGGLGGSGGGGWGQGQDNSGNDRQGGGFQIPWPRQRQNEPERRGGGGGFELPRPDMPEGGYPMPPIPGSTGSFPAPQGSAGPNPLPLPGNGGGNNPYGDLSDILRRGGQIGGAPSGGLVRNILGSLLGFRGGFMSWLIRIIVMRFGWGLLKRFLGRALTGGR